MGKHAPSAPDPSDVASAQTGQNIQTAIANSLMGNTNVYSPYGSSTFNQTGSTKVDGYDVPTWAQNIQLNPQQQRILDTQQATGLQSANLMGQLLTSAQGAGRFSPQNLPSLQSNVDSGNIQNQINPAGQIQNQISSVDQAKQIQDARDAAYNQQSAYLDPQFKQSQDTLDAQLANQGITQGSAAYGNAQDQQARNKTFAYQQAQNAAVQAGQNEQNVLFGQNAASGQFANQAQNQQYGQNANNANFANQAQAQQFGQGLSNANLSNTANQQQFGQDAYKYNLPFSLLSSLQGTSQIQNPQSTAPYQNSMQAPNIAGQINSNYQGELGSYNNSMSGLYGLGGMGAYGAMQSSWLPALFAL